MDDSELSDEDEEKIKEIIDSQASDVVPVPTNILEIDAPISVNDVQYIMDESQRIQNDLININSDKELMEISDRLKEINSIMENCLEELIK